MKEIRFIKWVFTLNIKEDKLVEIDERWNIHFWRCMPPITISDHLDMFAVGEPEKHVEYNGSYVPAYTVCFKYNGHFYATEALPVHAWGKEKTIAHVESLIKEYLNEEEK